MSGREGYVYLLASRKNGALYLGMTTDLVERLFEHQSQTNPDAHSARYKTYILVWFEEFDWIVDAIAREKTMKGWPRVWKVNTIENLNPDWLPLDPSTGEFVRD